MITPIHLGTHERRHSVAMECMFNQMMTEMIITTDEKMAVLSDNDALTTENIQLRQELAAKHREVA